MTTTTDPTANQEVAMLAHYTVAASDTGSNPWISTLVIGVISLIATLVVMYLIARGQR